MESSGMYKVTAYEDARQGELAQLRRQVAAQAAFIDHLQDTVFRLRGELKLLEEESDLVPVLARK